MKKIIDLIKSLFSSSKPAQAAVEVKKIEEVAKVVVSKPKKTAAKKSVKKSK